VNVSDKSVALEHAHLVKGHVGSDEKAGPRLMLSIHKAGVQAMQVVVVAAGNTKRATPQYTLWVRPRGSVAGSVCVECARYTPWRGTSISQREVLRPTIEELRNQLV
jgi:uncharacterized lipoprotein NlpE involved in copper resistance